MHPRTGGADHLVEGGVRDVGGAREVRRPEVGALRAHPLHLVRRDGAEHTLGGLPHRLQHDEVAQALQQVLDEALGVVARLDHTVHDGEEGRAVARAERADHVVEHRRVGVAQQGEGPRVVDPVGAGAADQLVEHRQRVAHRARPCPHDQRQHALADLHLLLLAEPGQVGDQRVRRDEPEGVVVRARPDGLQHLVRLGRGEHELHVLRRLLDQLEQRVEALVRDHVGLVDHVDLEPVPHRRHRRALAQLAGIVHTAVAGGVDLDHVEAAGPAAGELAARVTGAAGGRRRPLGAVEAAGEDARRRRLATAARTAEEVGVVDPARPQCLAQRTGDVFLPDDLGERLRAVAAVQRCRRPGTVAGTTDDGQPPSTPGAAAASTTRPVFAAGRRSVRSTVTSSKTHLSRTRTRQSEKDPSCTRQGPPTLAAFRPWGSSAG